MKKTTTETQTTVVFDSTKPSMGAVVYGIVDRTSVHKRMYRIANEEGTSDARYQSLAEETADFEDRPFSVQRMTVVGCDITQDGILYYARNDKFPETDEILERVMFLDADNQLFPFTPEGKVQAVERLRVMREVHFARIDRKAYRQAVRDLDSDDKTTVATAKAVLTRLDARHPDWVAERQAKRVEREAKIAERQAKRVEREAVRQAVKATKEAVKATAGVVEPKAVKATKEAVKATAKAVKAA